MTFKRFKRFGEADNLRWLSPDKTPFFKTVDDHNNAQFMHSKYYLADAICMWFRNKKLENVSTNCCSSREPIDHNHGVSSEVLERNILEICLRWFSSDKTLSSKQKIITMLNSYMAHTRQTQYVWWFRNTKSRVSAQIVAAEDPLITIMELERDILEICQLKRQSSTQTMLHFNLINDLVKLPWKSKIYYRKET